MARTVVENPDVPALRRRGDVLGPQGAPKPPPTPKDAPQGRQGLDFKAMRRMADAVVQSMAAESDAVFKQVQEADLDEPNRDDVPDFAGGEHPYHINGERVVRVVMGEAAASLDDLVFKVRDKLGVGFAITIVAPIASSAFENSRVCVSWHRLEAMKDKDGGKRVMFTATLTEAMEYVIEYERRYDEDGADAAAAWHGAEQKRRELRIDQAIEHARKVRAQNRSSGP